MSREKANDAKFDNRISQRQIRAGRLDRKELEAYINALPDLKDHSEEISPEIYGSERSRLAVTGEFISSEHDEDSI